MAAPTGNKNAVGNSGGRPYSEKNRKKAAMLKGLVIASAVKLMKKGTEKEQMEIILKLLPNCVPKSLEITGEDGTPLAFTVISYGEEDPINKVTQEDDSNPVPVPSKKTPSGVPE